MTAALNLGFANSISFPLSRDVALSSGLHFPFQIYEPELCLGRRTNGRLIGDTLTVQRMMPRCC